MEELKPRSRPRANKYDTTWDLEETEEGNLPINEDAHDKKYSIWKRRNWINWLMKNLTFPFQVKRTEDEDEAYYTDIADREPFRLGHIMEVIDLSPDVDIRDGIMIKAREGRRKGWVPLADVEVVSKNDPNYWPVREYVVWFANS